MDTLLTGARSPAGGRASRLASFQDALCHLSMESQSLRVQNSAAEIPLTGTCQVYTTTTLASPLGHGISADVRGVPWAEGQCREPRHTRQPTAPATRSHARPRNPAPPGARFPLTAPRGRAHTCARPPRGRSSRTHDGAFARSRVTPRDDPAGEPSGAARTQDSSSRGVDAGLTTRPQTPAAGSRRPGRWPGHSALCPTSPQLTALRKLPPPPSCTPSVSWTQTRRSPCLTEHTHGLSSGHRRGDSALQP